MDYKDLLITPFYLVVIITTAFIFRNRFTDEYTRQYFIPALALRLVAAILMGFLYQFYYSGGDTFNYHTSGSRHIWEAFWEDPVIAFKLWTNDGQNYHDVYKYASRIIFFHDRPSYAIVKLAAVFDLVTFATYTSTALFFALIGFCGSWMLFKTFYSLAPQHHRLIALATLFFPSVIFWGSGLLKDTITLACIGFATYASHQIFIQRKFKVSYIILLLLSCYVIYVVKLYILLTFLPSIILWTSLLNFYKLRSAVLKILMFPFIVIIVALLGYGAIIESSASNPKYQLESIAQTAKITAYDIRYWTGREAGSGYTLGELDGTWQSLISLAPAAINVSLFRPYLWEVKNPLMLMSAVESVTLLLLTFYVFMQTRFMLFRAATNPTVMFCLIFSICFAFAVGVSTFNFGTLARYKIPLLPFYSSALIFIYDYAKRERKFVELEATE